MRYRKNGQMNIQVNGETIQVDSSLTIADLTTQLGYQDQRIAVEINEAIIPKSTHAEFVISESDKIEIIKAVGGG